MHHRAPIVRRAVALGTALALVLLLVPAVSAGPQGLTYFLQDTPLPQAPAGVPHLPVQGEPLGNGQLVVITPPGLPPVPSNATDPNQLMQAYKQLNATQQRLIIPAQELVLPTQFVSNATGNTGHIWGPVIVLLFLPNSPTVRNANVSAQLVIFPKGASASDVPPTGQVIARTSFVLDYNSSSLPAPTSLIPPDPTNPTAAAGYVAAQLTAYGIGQVQRAYKIAYLLNDTKGYIIDKQVEPGSSVALRLVLEKGSSPISASALAAGQPIVYHNALTPSLVYVPWYAADPVRSQPTYTQPSYTSPTHRDDGGRDAGPVSAAPQKKKSPGLETPIVLAGLAALVLVARRRLR